MVQTKFIDLRYDFSNGDLVSNIINDVALLWAEDTYVQIVLLRLLIPKGQYILNPTLGSDLFTLKRMKQSSITEEMVYDIVYDALKVEIDEGSIELDDVTIDKTSSRDGIIITVIFTIVGGDKQNINFLLTT